MDIQNSLRQHGFELYESVVPSGIWATQNSYYKKISVTCEDSNHVYLIVSENRIQGHHLDSTHIEVKATVKRNGVWWRLMAYDLRPNELHKLPDIERKITQALSRL